MIPSRYPCPQLLLIVATRLARHLSSADRAEGVVSAFAISFQAVFSLFPANSRYCCSTERAAASSLVIISPLEAGDRSWQRHLLAFAWNDFFCGL